MDRYSGVADQRDIENVHLRLKLEEVQTARKNDAKVQSKLKEQLDQQAAKIRALTSQLAEHGTLVTTTGSNSILEPSMKNTRIFPVYSVIS